VIEVSGITKEFGRFTAVRNLEFTVQTGEVLGFLGPNGAGKTTTMRILTGYIPPTSGTARVAGHDVIAEPLLAKRKIGYLPENPPLYPEMTVTDYLDFVARIKIKGATKSTRQAKVMASIERCALEEVEKKLIGRLSKGYRQRVGLAQALVHDPEVLILDEPTAGLDPKQINDTRELIRSLGGDRTIVLSTHILPEVAMTCDRVVIINRGRVVAQGTTASLTERFRGAEPLEVTVAGSDQDARRVLVAIDGVRTVESVGIDAGATVFRVDVAEGRDLRSEISSRIVSAGLGLLGLHQQGMTLEEVYLRAISSEEIAEHEHAETAPLEPDKADPTDKGDKSDKGDKADKGGAA
jgi:gliding motility-associated transport system ATP-binding protein